MDRVVQQLLEIVHVLTFELTCRNLGHPLAGQWEKGGSDGSACDLPASCCVMLTLTA